MCVCGGGGGGGVEGGGGEIESREILLQTRGAQLSTYPMLYFDMRTTADFCLGTSAGCVGTYVVRTYVAFRNAPPQVQQPALHS